MESNSGDNDRIREFLAKSRSPIDAIQDMIDKLETRNFVIDFLLSESLIPNPAVQELDDITNTRIDILTAMRDKVNLITEVVNPGNTQETILEAIIEENRSYLEEKLFSSSDDLRDGWISAFEAMKNSALNPEDET